MTSDYSGTSADLEVARYGLRTFSPVGQVDNWSIMSWLSTTSTFGSTFGLPWEEVNQDTVLGSVYVPGSHWLDGTCSAECLDTSAAMFRKITGQDPTKHSAPYESCHCGIYATHSLETLISQYPYYANNLVAVIAAEGQTIIGEKGFRTQHARVVAYWCSPQYLPVCKRQFKDAKPYQDRDEMQRAYGLLVELKEPEKEKKEKKEETEKPSLGWSVSTQKQQAQSKLSLLKKLGLA